MLVANIATLTIAKAHMVAFWLFQQAADDVQISDGTPSTCGNR